MSRQRNNVREPGRECVGLSYFALRLLAGSHIRQRYAPLGPPRSGGAPTPSGGVPVRRTGAGACGFSRKCFTWNRCLAYAMRCLVDALVRDSALRLFSTRLRYALCQHSGTLCQLDGTVPCDPVLLGCARYRLNARLNLCDSGCHKQETGLDRAKALGALARSCGGRTTRRRPWRSYLSPKSRSTT